MSSTAPSVRWRSRYRDREIRRVSALEAVKDFLLYYLVEQPLVSAAVLWIICYPFVFLLYDDLLQSASTMATITVIFLLYIVSIIAFMLSIAFVIAAVFELRERRRRSRILRARS